jgi:hypothetical protein
MSKKKSKAKAKEAKPEASEIIKQAVIYVQQIAAYDAGFKVDSTDDSDFAGAGRQLRKSHNAMCKLIGLSPHKTPGAKPLTPDELFAKAGVLAAMYGLRDSMEPNEDELASIRFFAGEVLDFLAAHHQEAI